MSEILEENVTNETHEYVTVAGKSYKTESVITGAGSISFTISGMQISEAVTNFKDSTELSVSGEDLVAYGIYQNLTFESAMVDSEGLVTVTFHIANATETRIANLETTQTEQDDLIAEIMFGGEE